MNRDEAITVLRNTEDKMKAVLSRRKGTIPAVAVNGRYDNRADESIKWSIDNGLDWWTNGFWGGIMNEMHALTGDKAFDDECRSAEEKMDKCFSELFYGLHHDTGFMWLPMSVYRYILTGDPASRRRGIEAASLLLGRYNPNGFIRAWNEEGGLTRAGWTIIDSMMNISILFWASKETDDPRFRLTAVRHADTVMKNFIRENGSVRHIVEFDPETGAFVAEHGGQGYAEGTRWTRGQSWGIYGFANTYAHTGDRKYLDAAERIAERFIQSIPENGLIPVDFDQPEEPAYEDSTAAAIASSGLLTLSEITGNMEYRKNAEKILDALTEHRADFNPGTDGILAKCTGSYHGTSDLEVNFTYADFYYIEALMKIAGSYVPIW